MAKKSSAPSLTADQAILSVEAEEWPDPSAADPGDPAEGEEESPEVESSPATEAPPEPDKTPPKVATEPETETPELIPAQAAEIETPPEEESGPKGLPWGRYRELQRQEAQFNTLRELARTNPAEALRQLGVAAPAFTPQAPVYQPPVQPQVPQAQPGQPQFHPALGPGRPLIDPRQIPNPEEHPIEHITMRQEFTEQQMIIGAWNAQQQQAIQAQQFQELQLRDWINRSEANFKAQQPDYDDATQFLVESVRQEAIAAGVQNTINPQTGQPFVEEYVIGEAFKLRDLCRRSGVDFATAAYSIARQRGWKGNGQASGPTPLTTPEAQQAAKAHLAQVKKKAQASKGSLSSIPSAKAPGSKKEIRSMEDVMELTPEQMSALDEKFGEGWEEKFLE